MVDGQPSMGCGRAVGVAITAAHYVFYWKDSEPNKLSNSRITDSCLVSSTTAGKGKLTKRWAISFNEVQQKR